MQTAAPRFLPLPLVSFALASCLTSAPAFAADEPRPPVVVWPTLTPAGDAASSVALHKPAGAADKGVIERAQELDATLRDAVQDLGFTLFVADAGPALGRARDEDLIARAAHAAATGTPDAGTWVVSPRVESAGSGEYIVRIVVVPPRGRELRVRVERVTADAVAVRGLVMLRDLLSPEAAKQAAVEHEREQAIGGTRQGIMAPLRSQGRALLAVNAALFGGFTAFSVQRASGSDDPRVLYPLLALGTGVGIGSALLVADEWDVTSGDAWYLSAGAWWGAASGFLLAAGRNVQPIDDRYTWGVGGGLVGLSLATVALTRSRMDEGDAMLAHSGGGLGMLIGGATELLLRGRTTADFTPYNGMGYGAAIGLAGAGALATAIEVSPSRVLLVDVGIGGGALVGAAAASPLVVQGVTDVTETKKSAFTAAIVGGSVLGGAVAWWLTRDSGQPSKSMWLRGAPVVGVIGASATPAGATAAYGLGWRGPL